MKYLKLEILIIFYLYLVIILDKISQYFSIYLIYLKIYLLLQTILIIFKTFFNNNFLKNSGFFYKPIFDKFYIYVLKIILF